MEVFIEPIEAVARGLHLRRRPRRATTSARIAHEAGFRVHVVDDRAKFANRERFPDAAEVIVDDIPAWLAAHDAARPPPTPSIVTRGHRHDLDALRALAPRDLRYSA